MKVVSTDISIQASTPAPTIKPYGSWSSPINTDLIVRDTFGLDEIQTFQQHTYWIEKRPSENGRCVIVHYSEGAISDHLPTGYSARSRVHEYGGGSYCIGTNTLYFINDSDQQIYQLGSDAQPVKLTRFDNCRFADLHFDASQGLLFCICEDHEDTSIEPVNTLVAIDSTDGSMTVLSQGYDFYSNPVYCAKTRELAWLCWNHPNMPWDGTELWRSEFSGHHLTLPQICMPNLLPHSGSSASLHIFMPLMTAFIAY